MRELVPDEENRLLRDRIIELQGQLADAQAQIRELTQSGHEPTGGDGSGGDNRERALEAALQEAKSRADWLARLPGENPNPEVRVTEDGIVIYHNRAAADLAGWKCSVDRQVPQALVSFVDRSLTQGLAVEQQAILGGRDYWIYVVPFPREGYAHIYGRDITARRHAEEEVLHSREQLRKLNQELQVRNAELETERSRWQTVVESIADEVWACDTEGRISLMNSRAAQALHLDSFRAIPVTQVATEMDIIDADGQPRRPEEAPLLRSLSGETLHGQEIARDRRTGELRFRQYSTAPTRDAQGHITGAVGVVQDITPLKEAEKALAESRNRLNDILTSLGDGLMAVDRQWSLIYVNEAATRVAGRPAEELVGQNLWKTWPALLGTPVEEVYRRAMDERIPGQVRTRGVVHTARWFDISVYPSSEGITIYYIDKTDQVEADEARARLLEENREQSQLLQAMYEADPGGIAVFTKHDLRFTFANRAYRELLPLRGQDPVGSLLEEVWPPALGFHVLQSYLPPGRENEAVTHDKITRRFPDGSIRHFSVHLRPISWHGHAGTLVVAWEITQLENAKAALEEYAEKLKRSNQDLQEFATIASHDLQEPLRKIETFGDMLALRATGLDERSRDYVERMRNAAQRMRAMVEGVLQLSRVATQARPFEDVDLGALAEEVVSDLSNQVRRTHGHVEVATLSKVEGDPIQLRELLQNLVSNALKYHRPDVEPVVKVSSRQLPDRVEISVEDNGIGFEQEDAERIFQPFQRLVGRTEFEGSGMGLAICRRIVERHRGEIRARSAPGHGTTFTVTLPMSHSERTASAPGKESAG